MGARPHPLPSLLSRTLVARTTEADDEFEHWLGFLDGA